MILACPRCDEQIELSDQARRDSIVCPGCGIQVDTADAAAPVPSEEERYPCGVCGDGFTVDEVYADGDQFICHGCHGMRSQGDLVAAASGSMRPRSRPTPPARPGRSRQWIVFNIIVALAMSGAVVWFFAADRSELQRRIDDAQQAATSAGFEVAAGKFRDLSVHAAEGVPRDMVKKVQNAQLRWQELSQQRFDALQREMIGIDPESACQLYPVLRRLKDENLLAKPFRPGLDQMIDEVRAVFTRAHQSALAAAKAGDLPGALPVFRRLYVIAQSGNYPPEVATTLQSSARDWTNVYESAVKDAQRDLAEGRAEPARKKLQAIINDATGNIVPSDAAGAIREARTLLTKT